MKRSMLFLGMVLSAGCGGGSAASTEESVEETPEQTTGNEESTPESTEETAEAPPEPAGPTPAEVCVTARTRERECAAEFVPALVDLRIRIDIPAGIARTGRNARGRTRLLATAQTEFQADSTDERIAASCQEMAASIPADQLGPMVTAQQQCIAAADCAAFVECQMPLTEQRLRMPAAAEAPAEE
jgi:hypothetical protein